MTSRIPSHPLASDEAFRRRLVAQARHWLGYDSDAEDLVQDAYLRTADVELPQTPGSREAWLVTVTRNLCIDAWRRQGRHRAALEHVAGDAVQEDAGDQPARVAERAQRVEQALTHIARSLPAGDVASLLLYEVWGFTHAELGELAGRSDAASRQRLHRMQQRLHDDHAWGTSDDDDPSCLIALCRGALERRDPAALVAVLRAARPQGIAASLPAVCADAATATTAPQAELVQVDGFLGLRFRVGDGPATWLPLGEAVLECDT